MGEEFGLSRLDRRKRTWSWGLCDYLVVLVEDRVWITVPIVSCDITTCVMMNGIGYSARITCLHWCWSGMDIMIVLLNLIK